jgi:RimJ/RimL family protein N-acetyltransferase
MRPGAVALRPVEEHDLALLATWRNDRERQGEYGDFLAIHRRNDRSRARWEDDGLLAESHGALIVTVDAEPVGEVQWHTVVYGPGNGVHALNIGICLDPAIRGRGVGGEAQRLLAEFLFAYSPVHRVEASTDVANVAEQRALEKAGYTREGVLRGAQFRQGSWHDMVSYGRLRTDPPASS